MTAIDPLAHMTGVAAVFPFYVERIDIVDSSWMLSLYSINNVEMSALPMQIYQQKGMISLLPLTRPIVVNEICACDGVFYGMQLHFSS